MLQMHITINVSSKFANIGQLRPDIALTEPEQLNNLIQLSRGSFAASIWGHVKHWPGLGRSGTIVSMQ